MASEILDFESLLQPIPGDSPSGSDVRYTRYDAIKEARRADEDLPQGDWKPKGDPKIANWAKVIEMATTILSTESKDLQIAVWLLEALVKQKGFAGLRDGLKLLRGLHAQFWETVYPLVEEGDLEFRAAPIEWLNEKEKQPFFPVTVKMIPILHSHDGSAFSFYHWEESRAVENLGRQNPQALAEAVAEGKVTKEQVDKVEMATPLTQLLPLLEEAKQCWEEIQALDQVILEKFGEQHPDRPSLENIKEAVENNMELLDEIVQRKGGVGMSVSGGTDPLESLEHDEVAAAPKVSTTQRPGGIEPVDRLDALRRLAAVAEFFRRTEPHSPVAYLVQRAARWGKMPLEEWLNEVIKSEDVLGNVRETLGIQEEKSDS